MKNRLVHLADADVSRFVAFADAHRDLISRHHLLQKLTIFDFVSPVVAQDPHDLILEIGCGLGVHSALLSQFGRVRATELRSPGSFVGADSDVEAGRAAVLGALACNEVSFSYNDGRRLPYADGQFDVVFHNSVIEHVPDVVAFNREVLRVLKPGGICICITGTPVLCAFRFVKDYVLKFPLIVGVAIAREVRWAPRAARAILTALGVGETTVAKAEERLLRVDERLHGSAAMPEPADAPDGCSDAAVRGTYTRLYHFLYYPTYNRVVVEEIARQQGLSTDDLMRCVAIHFRRPINRLLFSLTPRTHGQHYPNALAEMREWRLARWVERFTQAGFAVERARGFRYHHVLEATPRYSWDAALYYRAVRFIHAAHRLTSRPQLASEFILVARKPRGPEAAVERAREAVG